MLVSSEECQLPLIAIMHLLFKFCQNKKKYIILSGYYMEFV